LRQVVIDTNVLVSVIFRRNEEQRALGLELFGRAGSGELALIFPQFVIFEAIHVLGKMYRFSPAATTKMLHEAMSLPGVMIRDDRPWPGFFEHWSNQNPDVGDAAILAIAIANGYSLATFDKDLSKRARTFGISPYW
jgi:predicted nucleic acid-binding protein